MSFFIAWEWEKNKGKVTDLELEVGIFRWGGNMGWEKGDGFYVGLWRLPKRT